MTVKECYEAIGGNYDEVMGRLRKDERVQKFLIKVPNDPSYELLCTSLANGDLKEAFRAAHTMKGICQNLALTQLSKSVDPLSDYLKEGNDDPAEIEKMMTQLIADYAQMKAAVSQLQ